MLDLRREWGWVVLLVVTVALGFLAAAPLAAQGNGNLPADLQRLIQESLQANAEIKQMRAQFAASKEAIRSAGALDDPEIAFQLKDIPTDTWAFNREPMTQKMLELPAEVPLPRQASAALRSGRGAVPVR